MEKHVQILGILNIVLGALGVIAALIVLAIFGGAAGIVGAAAGDDPDARNIVLPIIGVFGGVLFVFLTAISLPGIVAGVGLLKFRPWARLVTIVLSVLNLVNIPFGTALGVYGLWVLLAPGSEEFFERRSKA